MIKQPEKKSNAQQLFESLLIMARQENASRKNPIPEIYLKEYCKQRALSAQKRAIKVFQYDLDKGISIAQLENFQRQEDARKFGNKAERKEKIRQEREQARKLKRQMAKEAKEALKQERLKNRLSLDRGQSPSSDNEQGDRC